MTSNITPLNDSHPIRTMPGKDAYELLKDIQALWPSLGFALKVDRSTLDLYQTIKPRLNALLRP